MASAVPDLASRMMLKHEVEEFLFLEADLLGQRRFEDSTSAPPPTP